MLFSFGNDIPKIAEVYHKYEVIDSAAD